MLFFVVVNKTSVSRTVKVRANRIGGFIWRKSTVICRTTALTFLKANPNLLKSFRGNGLRNVFPISTRRYTLHHSQVEIAQLCGEVIWDYLLVHNVGFSKAS